MSKKFTTIVADPPWPYATPGKGPLQSSKEHRPNSFDYSRDGATAGSSAHSRYSLMTLDEIKSLPVKALTANNAHLYLWTTNGFLCEAHDVARAWGFRPVTVLTWVKVKPGTIEPSMKTGFYFRGATEHVVFAVRGSLRLQTTRGISTAFIHPRVAKHSGKPDAFFKQVEECSPSPRLELFARHPRDGWDVWGDQVESTVRVSADEPDKHAMNKTTILAARALLAEVQGRRSNP